MPRSRWSTTRLPPIVGVSGAAEILGVNRRTVSRWCIKDSGDKGPLRTRMPPWQTLDADDPGVTADTADDDARKLWVRRDVELFAEERRAADQRVAPPTATDSTTATRAYDTEAPSPLPGVRRTTAQRR